MYASIAAGFACIRTWKLLNADALASLAMASKPTERTTIAAGDALERAATRADDSADATQVTPPPLRFTWLKWLHGLLFIYAFAMLLGAGQAFLGNARVNGFPYANLPDDADVVDSLHGRCYGRDLRDAKAPAWLNALPCGPGEVCAVSVNGGANKYHEF